MELVEAALRNLVHVARLDGKVCDDEQELLRRYGEALDLPSHTVDRLRRTPSPQLVSPSEITASRSERRHCLKMMVRVACADGRLTRRERRVLRRVAATLQIGRFEFADLVVEVQRPAGVRRRDRTWKLATAAPIAFGLVLGWVWFSQPRTQAEESVFRELARKYAPSVLYVRSGYTLVRAGERPRHRSNAGTGFFVTANGYLVTNKHVVETWLFNPDVVKMRADGWEVDESTIEYAAWPAGREVLLPNGQLDLSAGYSTRRGTLALVATTPDRFRERVRKLASGAPYRGRFHALDSGDLAVLKATLESAALPLPLAPDDHEIRQLDPVMALGFPSAISAREHSRLETAPSLGEIRKEKETIFISAPIVGGNSGGPLFGSHGFVLGVCYATYGDSTLGGCIPARHVLALLPDAERARLR